MRSELHSGLGVLGIGLGLGLSVLGSSRPGSSSDLPEAGVPAIVRVKVRVRVRVMVGVFFRA